jgi:CD109 antigen
MEKINCVYQLLPLILREAFGVRLVILEDLPMFTRASVRTKVDLHRRAVLSGTILIFALLISPLPLPGADTAAALLVAPKKIFPGSDASVTLHAFLAPGATPRVAGFKIILSRGEEGGRCLAEGKTDSSGWARVDLAVPRDEAAGAGYLAAEVEGLADRLTTTVAIVDCPVLLVETDKPIYKPGQTIQARALLLNNRLRPLEGAVEVEIRDGKGNKIFRKDLATNAFGVAPFELRLADELNCGEWSIRAKSVEASTEMTVKVEPYVLPKFRLEVQFDKDWFLESEPITGTVRSSYFFGKPVEGQVVAAASRLDEGEWEEFARSTAPMEGGLARFEIAPVETFPEGGVSVDFVVTDSARHAEKTKQFVRIAKAPFEARFRMVSPSAKPGFPFDLAVESFDPGGKPVSASLRVHVFAYDQYGSTVDEEGRNVSTQGGRANVTFSIPADAKYLVLEADTDEGSGSRTLSRIYGPVAYSPSDSYLQLVRLGDGPVSVGEPVRFHVEASRQGATFYEVLSGGRSVLSGHAGDEIQVVPTPSMAPEAKLIVYRIFPGDEVGTDALTFEVRPSAEAQLKVDFDQLKAEPGAPVKLEISTGEQAMVGLAVVDESVFALSQGRLDLSRVYRELAGRFGGPSQEEFQSSFAERPHTVGALDVLAEAGLTVAVSGVSGSGSTGSLNIPEGFTMWLGGSGDTDGYGLPDLEMGGSGLAEVQRVRQFFPETWVWQPTILTDTAGRATLELTAPDSITNWKMRAVSTSSSGLGLAAGDLTVFQDFFVEPDLPYAVTRGENLWLPVAVYNYLDSPQTVLLEIEGSDGFQLLGDAALQVEVEPNAVKGASFPIRATGLGTFPFKITARSPQKADAVIRPLKVEAEGSPQEAVENRVLPAGQSCTFDTSFPSQVVPGSERLRMTITGSQVAQTIHGVEDLCGRPYG